MFQEFFNDTKITVTGLNPVTTYRFQISAENGVSDLVGEESKYVEMTVSTEASVASIVTNFRVISVKSSQVTLAWEAAPPMSNEASDEIETYEVILLLIFEIAGALLTSSFLFLFLRLNILFVTTMAMPRLSLLKRHRSM